MAMAGLFDRDSRLYYVDKTYAVMDNPYDSFNPTIVMRVHGEPNSAEMLKILSILNMTFDGDPFYRSDGLWCSKLKLNGARYGKT